MHFVVLLLLICLGIWLAYRFFWGPKVLSPEDGEGRGGPLPFDEKAEMLKKDKEQKAAELKRKEEELRAICDNVEVTEKLKEVSRTVVKQEKKLFKAENEE